MEKLLAKLKECLRTAGPMLLLAALCGVLYLPVLGRLPLMDPDESRCAVIVETMFRTGDWLMPQLDGKPYYDKPAPFFWLAAAGQRLTGSVEAGGRIVSVLAALASVLMAFSFARRLGGVTAGLAAGCILATSGFFVFLARWYRMDMLFSTCILGALWWFWRYESATSSWGVRLRRWTGVCAFCAVGTLVKGPAGLVLPTAAIGLYLLLSGRPLRVFEMLNPLAIVLFAAIASPYYIAMIAWHRDFAYEFLVVQNFVRYTGEAIGGHSFPGILYVPILFMGMLPWSLYLPGAAVRTFPRRWGRRMEDPAALFLWGAAILILLFFAFAHSKLVHYLLPMYGPLAVLMSLPIARWLADKQPDKLFDHGVRGLWGLVLIFVAAVGVGEGMLHWLDWSYALLAAGTAAMVVAAVGLRTRGWSLALAVTALTALLTYTVVQAGPRAYDEASSRRFAQTLARQAPAGAVVYLLVRDAYEFQRIAAGMAEIKLVHLHDMESLPADPAGRAQYALLPEKSLADLQRVTGRGTRIVDKTSRYCLVELTH